MQERKTKETYTGNAIKQTKTKQQLSTHIKNNKN